MPWQMAGAVVGRDDRIVDLRVKDQIVSYLPARERYSITTGDTVSLKALSCNLSGSVEFLSPNPVESDALPLRVKAASPKGEYFYFLTARPAALCESLDRKNQGETEAILSLSPSKDQKTLLDRFLPKYIRR